VNEKSLAGPRLLIVGASPTSLGAAIRSVAEESVWQFDKVVTAGITPAEGILDSPVYEDYVLDVTSSGSMRQVLGTVCPDIVICTVGVNEPCGVNSGYMGLRMSNAFRINVIGVMELLQHFVSLPGSGYWNDKSSKKFVAISSNSARIARRNSLAYCASKAALSMALRVAGRELVGSGTVVWGYEPGLLAGTPMTHATEQHFGHGDPEKVLHRMPGVAPGGMNPRQLAHQIVNDVANYSPAYNGMLIPFDAGEQ
jgi:NAD(P)-dependent dehydrogenase (short-subunit alcohol dehydrogenase family)